MGFFDKIKQGLAKTKKNMSIQMNNVFANFTGENEDFFDELEEALILADAGVETAGRAVETLRRRVKERGLRGGEAVRAAFGEVLTELLEVEDRALALGTKPSVILMVGVNGVGKTTTIGKLASRFTDEGKKVLLAAGDTFRAAAAEQLTVWAERSGAAIVRHAEGSDPAAVVFDGISAAKARGADLIIIDTAGRLHNKQNLMNELSKIARIISRELPEADRETLLVLDATTGQNGLIQAKQFKETADITGIVLTKLDGTAKGGIVFAIAGELGLPVKYIGVGESADDLMPFEPKEFVEALLQQ
jgi:fused signal recognition particle receptor